MTEPVQASATPIEALADKGPLEPPRSQWKDVWDQFRKHKGAMFGGGFLLFITLAVLVGPWIWQVDPQKLDIRNKDLRPIWSAIWDSTAKTAWNRPFGTDQLGRDQLAQILSGGRVYGCRLGRDDPEPCHRHHRRRSCRLCAQA